MLLDGSFRDGRFQVDSLLTAERVASSLNFFRRSSLPGPEEAPPFHNITVNAVLTVGFSLKSKPHPLKRG